MAGKFWNPPASSHLKCNMDAAVRIDHSVLTVFL